MTKVYCDSFPIEFVTKHFQLRISSPIWAIRTGVCSGGGGTGVTMTMTIKLSLPEVFNYPEMHFCRSGGKLSKTVVAITSRGVVDLKCKINKCNSGTGKRIELNSSHSWI